MLRSFEHILHDSTVSKATARVADSKAADPSGPIGE